MANMAVTKKVLRFSIEKQLPLVLWGEAGIGKTEAVEQIADELGHNLVVLHLATQDVADLIGVPVPVEGKTVYFKPSWFVDEHTNPKIADPNRPTIYFLDEFNRANRAVLACMLPFLLTGKIHEHTVGPKDSILCACNFADEDYDVQELTDKALRDRCGHIILRPEAKEFFSFAKNKIDDVSMAMLKADDRILDIANKELEFKVEPSRRKIVQVMIHFKKIDDLWLKEIGIHILQHYLGEAYAGIFLKTFKEANTRLSIEEILEWSKETQKKVKRFTTGDVRVDIIDNANDQIMKYLKANKKKKSKITKKQLQNIFRFLFSCPADVIRTFVEKLMEEVKIVNGKDLADQLFDFAEEVGEVEMIKVIVESYS